MQATIVTNNGNEWTREHEAIISQSRGKPFGIRCNEMPSDMLTYSLDLINKALNHPEVKNFNVLTKTVSDNAAQKLGGQWMCMAGFKNKYFGNSWWQSGTWLWVEIGAMDIQLFKTSL